MKMMFFTYILQSDLDGSFYIGQTKDIEKRIFRHNKGYNRSTKAKSIIFERNSKTLEVGLYEIFTNKI